LNLVIPLLLRHGIPAADLVSWLQPYVLTNAASKQSLVSTLGAVTPPPPEAASLLRDLLKDTNASVRHDAALAVARFGEDGKDAVPELQTMLGQATFAWRDRAVAALSTMGPSAKDALPQLMDLWRTATAPEAQARLAGAILAIDKDRGKPVLDSLRS